MPSRTVAPPTPANGSDAPGAPHGAFAPGPTPAQADRQNDPEPQRKPDQPRPEYSQWTSLSTAIEESRRNGKPILLDFNADWCPPCQAMKRQVFEDGEGAQVVQTAVIPVSIVDRVREEGRNPDEISELQRRYDIDAFPTLVVFSPTTGRMMKSRGFGGAEATVQWIAQAAQSVK